MNQIEDYKREKDGLDVLADLPRYARAGWETITDGDKERLKWLGVFFRRRPPGSFILRLRFTHGVSNAAQFRVIAALSRDFGKNFVDLWQRRNPPYHWPEHHHPQYPGRRPTGLPPGAIAARTAD